MKLNVHKNFGENFSTTTIPDYVLLRVFNLCLVLPEAISPPFSENIRRPPERDLKSSCAAKDVYTFHLSKEKPSWQRIKYKSLVQANYLTSRHNFSQSFVLASRTLPHRIITVGEMSGWDQFDTQRHFATIMWSTSQSSPLNNLPAHILNRSLEAGLVTFALYIFL